MPLYFKNSCKYAAHVVLRVSLREDESPAYCLNPEHSLGQWCTRPWVTLAPGETSAEPLGVSDNRYFSLLAWAADANNLTVSSENSPGDDPVWLDTKSGRSCKEGSRSTCKPFRVVRSGLLVGLDGWRFCCRIAAGTAAL